MGVTDLKIHLLDGGVGRTRRQVGFGLIESGGAQRKSLELHFRLRNQT
jgi:hypothetical protein